ncbi:hypothetical protein CHLNCDRAFT_57756 [Chlorella variabilis]|uniref:Glycoside hydrolase family 3 N-terminal domain-containing protein n=1 Tax=Chlorella variabilis TaxID=554065 RepID=E1ZED0_CHLVA|nr:hypothetical protein CHLNCDRAFT_57756 [Chlorella variabilis]EFN55848.1 hypothetical protein CHLNCDRAFT_57756 [Chlorella variabilis]|eukprot:XP_005847950.1 hypothetical protein CHLNCDRAFT_57756 [Chlorella variabilis]
MADTALALLSVALACCAALVAGQGANSSSTAGPGANSAATHAWLDTSLPPDERAAALVAAMTGPEKLAQLESSPAKRAMRLGISSFYYQRECLHGMVADNGEGTMYPQPMAWAATFNPALTQQVASQIGDEMRGMNNAAVAAGRGPQYTHCFGPHPAIVRLACLLVACS